jgi:integrase
LRTHRARQLERRVALGLGRPAEDSPVFASWDGKFRVPIRTTQRWIETMRELGLSARLHALRHTHVSQLISDGADVLTISRRLGHANASITLNVYAHLFRNTDAAVAEASDRFMRGLVD